MDDQPQSASNEASTPSASQNMGNTTASGPGSSTAHDPYDPVQAHDAATAFFTRFVPKTKGMTLVFFGGCIAYNRTLDAIHAERPPLPLRRQEAILRAVLAEWKRRLLAGPVDDVGREHREMGLKNVESLNRLIVVDDAADVMLFGNIGWDANKSAALADLVQGRNPGDRLGLPDFQMRLFDSRKPGSLQEVMSQICEETKDVKPVTFSIPFNL